MGSETKKVERSTAQKWVRRVIYPVGGLILISLVQRLFVDDVTESLSDLISWSVGLLSDSVTDSIYSRAATNPTTESALLLHYMAVTGLFSGFLLVFYVFLKLRRSAEEDIPLQPPAIGRWVGQSRSRTNGLFAICFLVMGALLLQWGIASKADTTWRHSQANMTIVRPHVDEKRFHVIQAQFASIRTETDYEAFHAGLQVIAKHAKLKLRGDD